MATSMYFSSNQSKQKAFDRYYNAMARSNFKQGVKLKALINQEAADASLADQLASMYMQAVGKTRDYEYDTVNDKMKRAKPPVVKGSIAKTREVKVNIPKKSSKATRKYVHESTDSDLKEQAKPSQKKDVNQAPPVEGVSMIDDDEGYSDEEKAPAPATKSIPLATPDIESQTFEEFNANMSAFEGADEFLANSVKKYSEGRGGVKRNIRQDVARDVSSFIKQAKSKRKGQIDANRAKAIQSQIEDTIMSLVENASPPPSPPSSPLRSGRSVADAINLASSSSSSSAASSPRSAQASPKKGEKRKQPANHPPLYVSPNKHDRKIRSTDANNVHTDRENEVDYDMNDVSPELFEERRLAQSNPFVVNYYNRFLNGFTSTSRTALYNEMKLYFKSAVDSRHGDGFYADNMPKPSGYGQQSQDAIDAYKKDVKQWLDGIFTTKGISKSEVLV